MMVVMNVVIVVSVLQCDSSEYEELCDEKRNSPREGRENCLRRLELSPIIRFVLPWYAIVPLFAPSPW